MKPLLPLTLSLALLSPLSGESFIIAAPKKPAAKPKPKPKTTAKPKPTPKPTPKTPTPTPIPIATGPKTWALLVGVSRYDNAGISSLNFPAKDAAGLRNALIDPALGGLAPSQVLMLTDANATRAKISGAVDSFLRPNVKPGDKVIVFLAGHGVAKGAGTSAKSYFLPSDVAGLTVAALENSAVPVRSISESLASLPASQFVVLVDACREDPTPGRGLKGNSLTDVLSRGIAVVPQNKDAESATFFACSVGQRAFEDPKYGHGVFTNWIIEGIKQGAVARKPDGAVDMGILSSYVSKNVGDWAKATSASGDFEISQTPELLPARELKQQIVLFNVKGNLPDVSFAATPPRLFVAASPVNAQVSIDGVRAGVGFAEKMMSASGDHTIVVSAPGFAPVSRSVKALEGYENQIAVQLQPLAGAVGTAVGTEDPALEAYRRALVAQEAEQWEIAEQGFREAMRANPNFTAAYEALIELDHLSNRNLDAIADALTLLNTGRNPHTLSVLSRAYSLFAEKGAGEDNARPALVVTKYNLPKKPDDAVKMAQRAATEALALGNGLPETNLAQGYALAALDIKAKNKAASLAAFGKAAFLDSTDAANYLGYGYGLRFYALQLKDEAKKRAELARAIAALQQAATLRPDFYEAHRELAFCYIALDDTANALRECRLARSNRGGAADINEIAGIELAMSGLHAEVAQKSTGNKKAANEAASQGYVEEAKETSRGGNLQKALAILNGAGVSTSLASYLPAEYRQYLDLRGMQQNAVNDLKNKATGAIGGLFGK